MRVRFIQDAAELRLIFPHLKSVFSRVVNKAVRGEFSADDIERLAEQGAVTVGWAEDETGVRMVIAFEFIQYPRMLAVNVLALAGDKLHPIVGQFMAAFREFCRIAGANAIEASCSPAMVRMLSRYGFCEQYRVIRSLL